MLRCTERKALVTFTADPPEAELWIDGKRQNVPPGTTLSVPFCAKAGTIDVLWRAPGRVNCLRTVALTPDADLAVSCGLTALANPKQ